MDEQLDRLVAEVTRSGKYAHIVPNLVARIGSAELQKGRRFKEAVKATKNKLHQVGAAYLVAAPHYERWLNDLRLAEDRESFKQVCWMVMAKHASTRERLGILPDIYAQLFQALPPIHSVLDVACGLNPLAIPWMPLGTGARYVACDMYRDMVDFLNAVFTLLPVDGTAQVSDVVTALPDEKVDLALIMKAIPCLEQIDKSAGDRLLDGLNARYLAISFPAKSLGGRSKGMIYNYEVRFEELTAWRGWEVLARLEFATELVFVLEC